jgi:hypothetical protein
MRTFLKREWICAFALFAFFSLAFCSKGLADDAGKSSDSTRADTDTTALTTAAKKPVPVSPPGLTEREQWLLNRVEQLEKRVEELEAKEHVGSPSATPANATVAASGHAGTPAGAPRNSAAPATTAAGNVANSGVASSAGNVQPGASSPVQPKQDQSTAASASAAASEPQKPVEPFSDADWTWLNGNARTKDIFWDTKFFTPEIRADTHYVADFNHPTDHSMGGSSELFRTYEVQLEQLGVGGDFHYDNVRARLMTQFGMYSETTPRNDPSPGHG